MESQHPSKFLPAAGFQLQHKHSRCRKPSECPAAELPDPICLAAYAVYTALLKWILTYTPYSISQSPSVPILPLLSQVLQLLSYCGQPPESSSFCLALGTLSSDVCCFFKQEHCFNHAILASPTSTRFAL